MAQRSAATTTIDPHNADNFGPIPATNKAPPRPKLLTNAERRAISLRIGAAKERNKGVPLANWSAAERAEIEADLATLAARRRRVVGIHPALPALIAQQAQHEHVPAPTTEAAYLAAKRALDLQSKAGREEARRLKEALLAAPGGGR